jgi:hypothetical protein
VEVVLVKHRLRPFNKIFCNIDRIGFSKVIWGFVSIKIQLSLNSAYPFDQIGDSPMG